VVKARLVQPGLRKAMQRPQHARRPEVDAVKDGGIAVLGVERMHRPPVPAAQRVLGVTRDGPDLGLHLGRAPRHVQQWLVSACVVQPGHRSGHGLGVGRRGSCRQSA
jgi:hypothetical protein